MSELIPLPVTLIPFLNPYLPPQSQFLNNNGTRSLSLSPISPVTSSSTAIPDVVKENREYMKSNIHFSNNANNDNNYYNNERTFKKSYYPFITLTYAQSLDSRISIGKGLRTTISHLETKTMTHYLRSKHDGILIGIGTFLDDDPGLNSRFNISNIDIPPDPTSTKLIDANTNSSPSIITDSTTTTTTSNNPGDSVDFAGNTFKRLHMIRPIIIDPNFKLMDNYENSKLHKLVLQKMGLSPVAVVSEDIFNKDEITNNKIKDFCQKFDITLAVLNYQNPKSKSKSKSKSSSHGDDNQDKRFNWCDIFKTLKHLGLNSVMVEGGATIINELINFKDLDIDEYLIDSLIITIGPVFLGKNGVEVSPNLNSNLKDVQWWRGIQDSVLCARLE
ncbi:unnamed protein product [[Candida] boidinii]|nr:hypothetical protein BVG19_g2612 [[Candida] boidinii]OWB48635.1 hypothetical protein B5S27_g170 [[Candida] boidinii]OWB83205.1 hypothetical protein B5S33_g1834 [[Candida] boidinii]GME87393.1 unnamed protein product [[Candida] boidinii]